MSGEGRSGEGRSGEGRSGEGGAGDARMSGAVAVIIAFATLMAAVAGLLQADAANQSGDRRLEAEQLSLRALASAQSGQQSAQVELETFARWVEQRTQAGNALLQGLYAGSDPDRAAALQREEERWSTIADSTLALSDIDPEGEYGPDRDPTFPARYFAAASEESLRLNALEDAANEEAAALDGRAAAYTAILATLAVSVYLFGLTLAVSGAWLRRGFLAVGLVLLAVGVAWMAQTLLTTVPETDDEAAAEFARGRVAALTAHDSGGYAQAEAHYGRALELRPTFGRAYAERADVIFLGATPQAGGFVSIVPPEALQRARADLEQARALGLENAQTLGSLGFYGFLEGVQTDDAGLLERGAEFTRRAIALDPREPIYRYNLAVTLVVAGRHDEARNAYQDAVARTIYVDDALSDLRLEPSIEEFWLAGALTDLEIIARHKPELADQVRGFKEQIVGRVTRQSLDAPPASPATFSDVTLDFFPAQLQWQGKLDGYDATRDVISAQWYHEDPSGLGWAVIPQVSLTQTPSIGPDGRLFLLSPYMSRVVPPACLPAGRYRAEIYINGRLAAQDEVTADVPDYEAFAARDLTMALCRPADWQRLEDRLPALIDGFTSSDDQFGVMGARYGLPGSLHTLPDISALMHDLTIEAFADWFPAPPEYLEESGTTNEYFLGLESTAWRWYDYGSGYVRVASGLTGDGAAVVGMVFGPYAWFDTDEPYRILNSMIYFE